MNAEPWVSATDLAQHQGIVKDTVYRRSDRKGLPAHKTGQLRKRHLSEVDECGIAGGADEDTSAGATQKNEND